MSILNTRDQEFVEAKKRFEDYKENNQKVANDVGLFDTNSENYPVAEIRYEEWETETLYKVYQAFEKEYERLLANEEYFFGCPLDIYKKHFKKRMEAYYNAAKNSSEVGFILNEFAIGKLDFDYGVCSNTIVNILDINLKLRYNYLLERLIVLGYDMEGILDIDRSTQPRISPFESEIDLSDNNAKEKLIFMNELGVIEYLRANYRKANLSNNKLAQLLSSFTGVKPATMQSYLNPILNSEERIDQHNNPYNNTERVNKIRSILKTDFYLDLSNKA